MHAAIPRAVAWIILVLIMLFSIALFSVVMGCRGVPPLANLAKAGIARQMISPEKITPGGFLQAAQTRAA